MQHTVRDHQIEGRWLEARFEQIHLKEVRAIELVLLLEPGRHLQ
jgi:hypothetical protein